MTCTSPSFIVTFAASFRSVGKNHTDRITGIGFCLWRSGLSRLIFQHLVVWWGLDHKMLWLTGKMIRSPRRQEEGTRGDREKPVDRLWKAVPWRTFSAAGAWPAPSSGAAPRAPARSP